MTEKYKIAVLFGGTSMERDVSVASAAQIVAALRSRGHSIRVVDAAKGLLSDETAAKVLDAGVANRPPDQIANSPLACLLDADTFAGVDVVFNAMHGGAGEDGTVQALLDIVGIPYTGSGKLGSTLAMDKEISKQLFRCVGVPTASWFMAPIEKSRIAAELGYPVIVKPNSQGSTVGLTLVTDASELESAITHAAEFGDSVMVERYVPGREITVGILDGDALPVGEIFPAHGGLFDYEAKYQSGQAQEVFPAVLDPALADEAQRVALLAANALKLDSYCRIDFRLDPDNKLWCLEANTLPGMTAASLLPRAAAAAGIDFPDLCERIARLALR